MNTTDIVGSSVAGAWIAWAGFVAVRGVRRDRANQRRVRYENRAEFELLDTMPAQWVTHAEELFDAEQEGRAARAEVQRQRQLRAARGGGVQ